MKIAVAVLGLVMMCATTHAFAFGVGSSGGAKALVCRDDAGKILSARLLDLYEAEALHGLTLRPDAGSLDDEYADAVMELERINGTKRSDRQSLHLHLRQHIWTMLRFVDLHALEMEELDDTGSVPEFPAGCRLEQAAVVYAVPTQSYVNQEIWTALDEKNKAALIMHEVLYGQYLRVNEVSSFNLRKVIAHLFSEPTVTPLTDDLPDTYYKCEAGRTFNDMEGFKFFLYHPTDGRTVLRFARLGGRETAWPVEVTLPVHLVPALELGTQPGSPATVVDGSTSFNGVLPITNGLFEEYSVAVRYERDHPFTLSLVTSEGKALQQNPTIACVAHLKE